MSPGLHSGQQAFANSNPARLFFPARKRHSMQPYQNFVAGFGKLLAEGRKLPLGGFPPAHIPPLTAHAPRALIFSPHPDDEVIIGGLPLRLLRELKMNVINVAVTQGSNKTRQPERWKELTACCQHIGFGLVATCPGGLEG